MTQIKLGNVRYNPQAGAYEARVDILRDGKTYRYPCQTPGPIDMSFDAIASGLTRHALRMSDSGASLMSTYH